MVSTHDTAAIMTAQTTVLDVSTISPRSEAISSDREKALPDIIIGNCLQGNQAGQNVAPADEDQKHNLRSAQYLS